MTQYYLAKVGQEFIKSLLWEMIRGRIRFSETAFRNLYREIVAEQTPREEISGILQEWLAKGWIVENGYEVYTVTNPQTRS